MKNLVLVFLLLGLVGCGKSQEEIRIEKEAQRKALEQAKIKKLEQEQIKTENEIKKLIKNDLLDPESAIFKFQKKNDSSLYCGTVNSKNSFGGYVGDTRFFSSGYAYRLDKYQPSDDLLTQIFHLKGFEQKWIQECEGVKPKAGVNLKECDDYSQMALVASYFYINNKDIPFSDLKKLILKSYNHQKYLSEFFDAVRTFNVSYKDQSFPMMYAKVNYVSCLEGDMSPK